MKNEKVPGEFVTSVTVAEVLKSAGIQLASWANDIAFTDAPFGETWAVETADRMVCVAELLYSVYVLLPSATLERVVGLPPGVIGQIAISPLPKPRAEKPVSKDTGDSDREGGSSDSIDDFPF